MTTAPQKKADATPGDDILVTLSRTYSNVNEYLRAVDTKAGVTFLLSAGILGGLLERGVEQHLRHPQTSWLIGIFAVTTFLFLLTGAGLAALTVIPHFRWLPPRTSCEAACPPNRGFTFFGDIAGFPDGTAYLKALEELPDRQAALAEITHQLSRVCYRKYRWCGTSIALVIVGGALSIACFLWCPPNHVHDESSVRVGICVPRR